MKFQEQECLCVCEYMGVQNADKQVHMLRQVQLPACIICVDVGDAKAVGDAIGAAISAGATGVLLTDDRDAGPAISDTFASLPNAKNPMILRCADYWVCHVF